MLTKMDLLQDIEILVSDYIEDIQEENQKLRAQIAKLEDESLQKDFKIIKLEYQIEKGII